MVFCFKTLTKHFIIFEALDIIPGWPNYSDSMTFMRERGSLSFYLSVYGDERILLQRYTRSRIYCKRGMLGGP